MLNAAAPAHDVTDQQRPARPEPVANEVEQVLNDVRDILETDPADLADQHRDAPVLDKGERWP